jgi:hypothetical protein
MAWVLDNKLATALALLCLGCLLVLGVSQVRLKAEQARVQTLTLEVQTHKNLLESQRLVAAARQNQIDIAWAEVKRLRAKGKTQYSALQTALVPVECKEAVRWGTKTANDITSGWR